jgi:hypothetical protein
VKARPLRWGFAHNDTLDRNARAAPGLPAGVTLATQFLRIMAVDLDWHLLGNRSAAPLASIPGDDDTVPDFALPRVRTAVPGFDYLIDGVDVLGAASQIATGFPPAGVDVMALLASPAIDTTVPLPPGPGAAGHWPAFPGPNPGGGLPATSDATQGLSAVFRAPGDGDDARLDVIVTIAAGVVPPGTHLRVYPRRFVEISAISSATFVCARRCARHTAAGHERAVGESAGGCGAAAFAGGADGDVVATGAQQRHVLAVDHRQHDDATLHRQHRRLRRYALLATPPWR